MNQQTERTFAEGIYYNTPNQSAPEYIKANVTIQVERFVEWLKKHTDSDGKVRIAFMQSRNDPNRIYGQLDTYKPKQSAEPSQDTPATRVQEQFAGEVADGDDVPF